MSASLSIASAWPNVSLGWRRHLIGLGAVWAAILLLFHRDAARIVALWSESATFNHCFFIPPLIAWLVWQRMPELRRLEPAAWAAGLLLSVAGAAGWLLGEAGSLAAARHLGLVLMLQGAVIACLGNAVARGLLFPLFYALFLVPVGEEIVPLMQTVTAKLSMALLALVGTQAQLDGIFITTPAGYFRVAAACSGVMFLIAMLAYGALVANLCFRSWTRRILFLLAAITLTVLANGIRAAGTIWIAGKTGVEFAIGFDHVFYGWIFFAIVIVLLMAASWRFFDRGRDDPWFDPADLQPEGTPAGPVRRLVRVAAAAVALAAVPPLWSAAIVSAGSHEAPAEFVLPDVPGWQRIPADTGRAWQAHFAGADSFRIGRYRDAQGREVDLAISVFARQEEGRELVGYGQGAVAPGGDWSWTADSSAPANGRAEFISSHRKVREVLSFYRVGDTTTGSAAAVKLATIKTRLLGGPQRAVAVLVSAEARSRPGDSRPAIDSFVAALGPVDRLADAAAGLHPIS